GSGKTAVSLSFAVHVATGNSIGNLKVKKGPVLYIAGENPTDVGERLKAMFPNQPIPENLHMVPRPGRKEVERAIAHLIAKGIEISFIVIDTSAAYFEGDDETNTEMQEHAMWLRSITERIPGKPTVLACCHPVKNATVDNMIPRGGGAFLNAVDGNIQCFKKDDLTELKQDPNKYRGANF